MAITDRRESDDREDGEREAFRSLIDRVRAGDNTAAAELVRQYEPEIRRFVRLHLTTSPLRRLLDSVDVSQSVLARFFLQLTANQIEVDKPQQLVRLLSTMARNRLVDHVREHKTQRRGGQNRQDTLGSQVADAADLSADPSELAARRDLATAIRAALAKADRDLVEQRLLGFEWRELAEQFRQSPEALRKRFTRAVDRAAQRLGLLETGHE